MKNRILVELTKKVSRSYEKTVVYTDGTVEFETLNNGELLKEFKMITIVDDLALLLQNAYIIMNLICDEEKSLDYKIVYNNQNFYSLDLYIDIYMMIKNNQIKKLSVFGQYDKLKKDAIKDKQIASDILILDEMEKNKKEIDITDVKIDIFDNERKIISFKLEENNNFKLGESRFFSDTIDISDNIDFPSQLVFVGQLNLNEMSKYDIKKMLPQTGMLYFFQNPYEIDGKFYDFGKVIYSDDMNLIRKQVIIEERYEHMVLNLSLKDISNNIEDFNKRYYEDDVWGHRYNSFYGEDLNKIYGFYTDCQIDDEDVKKISSKYIVLLQLGSDIYGEGITTFLISESDLRNKNFDNIIFKYSQS